MRAGIFALLLALAACGQSKPPSEGVALPDAARVPQLVLTCAEFTSLSPPALTERFGVDNISVETMPGPEGETYEATLVFADDPARRLEIIWNETNTAIASVMVSNEGTEWRGERGYTIGTPIAEIESANVMPFKLWGFDWDYGGWVSDWNLGTFAQTPGCNTRIRFAPRNDNTAASGDREFASNDRAVRAADPAIAAFGLMFSAP